MRRLSRINSEVWLQNAWRNRLQSVILLTFMGGFLALLGGLLWGSGGIIMLLMMGIIAVIVNPSVSPRLIMRLYGAKPIAPAQAPELWHALAQLADRAKLPIVPTLYYVPSRLLNAFAVGNRNQAAIAVTDGLLRKLELRELVGVLAHEISHIRNNDIWVMGLADMFSRATSVLSFTGLLLLMMSFILYLVMAISGIDFWPEASISWLAILLLIFAPALSSLAQLALSRTREYDADLNAAWLTGDTDGLASALAKIERIQGGWLEYVFLPGHRVPVPSILRTHPQTRERVARLMALKPTLTGLDWYDLQKRLWTGEINPAVFGKPIVRNPSWHISGLWY